MAKRCEKRYANRQLGVTLHHWHWGQGDPIYGVGSLIFAGDPVPCEDVESAVSGLQRLWRQTGTRTKQDRAERRELRGLVAALKKGRRV